MDADKSPTRRPAPSPGGTVEPVDRATVAKDTFQTPIELPGERYELRDPFAEVTYRAKTLPEILAKAEQLGSTRIVAVDPEGQRTLIDKINGEWQRGPQRAASPASQAAPAPMRDEVPEASNVVPMPQASKAALTADAADVKSIAQIDAQAERAAQVARMEAVLMERYLIRKAPVTVGEVTVGRTEYRFRGDTSRVAFTESTFRLATDTNSPSVARSMVDVAQVRNWRALRVSGNDDFKRLVWLEASVRGVKTLGYEPNPSDLEVQRKEREARQVNRIDLARTETVGDALEASSKASVRGGGGRKAVLAAIEAVLVAKRVPDKQREAILAAATENLAQRIRDGQTPKVKVYDKAAPSQRPAVPPTPEAQRTRERAAPVR